MDVLADELLMVAASRMKGTVRRRFLAEVCERLCEGNSRRAVERFGWGRETIVKGQAERDSGPIDPKAKTSCNRGQKRSEVANPQLAIDIRLIVEPRTQSDPELKSERQYTNMSAAEVRQALRDRGYTDEQLPSERTLRDILNRMNYRLKRIQKGKPLKKTASTDAIFKNFKAVHAAAADDPETPEISVDTKAKVKLGEYSQGEKTRIDSEGNVPQALDHDRHAPQIRHHHQTPAPRRQVNSLPPVALDASLAAGDLDGRLGDGRRLSRPPSNRVQVERVGRR